MSDEAASEAPSFFSRSCRSCWSCSVICSTGKAPMISSRTVGKRARTVYVQSSWFCSNLRRKLSRSRSDMKYVDQHRVTYFSFDVFSSLMRSRASLILPSTYWPATYPPATTPAPISKEFLLRRTHRRVAVIIATSGRSMLLTVRIDWSELWTVSKKRLKMFVSRRSTCAALD